MSPFAVSETEWTVDVQENWQLTAPAAMTISAGSAEPPPADGIGGSCHSWTIFESPPAARSSPEASRLAVLIARNSLRGVGLFCGAGLAGGRA